MYHKSLTYLLLSSNLLFLTLSAQAQNYSAAPNYSAQPSYGAQPSNYHEQIGQNKLVMNGIHGGQITQTATHTIINGATFHGSGSNLNRISAHSKGKVILNNVRIISSNTSATPVDISAKHVEIRNVHMLSNGANIQHSNCPAIICIKNETAHIDNLKVDVKNQHHIQTKNR